MNLFTSLVLSYSALGNGADLLDKEGFILLIKEEGAPYLLVSATTDISSASRTGAAQEFGSLQTTVKPDSNNSHW